MRQTGSIKNGYKKIIALVLAAFFLFSPVFELKAFAVDDTLYNHKRKPQKLKSRAVVNMPYDLNMENEFFEFETTKDIILKDNTVIPLGSKVVSKLYQGEKERRWHKAGFFISQILNYSIDDIVTDVSDKEIYFVAKKYEKINRKEAAILATELILMSGASFFAPGVDVGYFFIKGAIQRKKHPNWFRAGVSNAYDNSICWIWLKGAPINLEKGDFINIKGIDKDKAQKLGFAIDKRHTKKEVKQILKEEKTENKLAQKLQKKAQKELIAKAKAENKHIDKQNNEYSATLDTYAAAAKIIGIDNMQECSYDDLQAELEEYYKEYLLEKNAQEDECNGK